MVVKVYLHFYCRIKVIGEILSGIRIIKFFNWEDNFKAKIESVRAQEINQLKFVTYLRYAIDKQ